MQSGFPRHLDPRWLAPSTDTMVISRAADISPVVDRADASPISPGRVALGSTIQKVRRVRDGAGHDVLEVAFEQRDTAIVVAQTTTWVDAHSLQPIRQQAALEEGRVVTLTFDGRRVAMVDSTPGRPSQSYAALLPDSAYASSAVDLVLRALPLANGYHTTVPLYFPAEQMVFPVAVHVEGIERIALRSGRTAVCWVVAADFPGDITERFWIDQHSHAMVRILAHDGPMALVRYDK